MSDYVVSPMKTLHIVLALDVGGLERVVLLLADASRETGDEVAVLCLDRRGDLGRMAADAGITIWSGEDYSHLPKHERDKSAVQSALEEFQPDMVHTHQIGVLYRIGTFLKRSAKIPVIHTEHGNHFARTGSWWKRLKNRWIWYLSSAHCDSFCCVSEEIRDSMIRIGIPYQKVRVVPNGVETSLAPSEERVKQVRDSLGLCDGDMIVGSLGRLAPVKRLDILLNSFDKISRTLEKAKLVIVGDGPTRSELESQTRQLGLSSRVVFAGYQDTPQDYIATFDVFALSSESEGMPMAILEAFAQGVPVVATRVGAIQEMVADGSTGYVVPFGDSELAADRILKILTQRTVREQFSRECRRVVQDRFSRDAMYNTYRTIAADLVGAIQA